MLYKSTREFDADVLYSAEVREVGSGMAFYKWRETRIHKFGVCLNGIFENEEGIWCRLCPLYHVVIAHSKRIVYSM